MGFSHKAPLKKEVGILKISSVNIYCHMPGAVGIEQWLKQKSLFLWHVYNQFLLFYQNHTKH